MRRTLALATLAAFATTVSLVGCIGSPPGAPPLSPEDNFSLGTGKLLVTYQGEDRVAIVNPTKFALGAAAIDRVLPVGPDPFEIDAPHEAVLSPLGDAFYVTVQTGPRTWGKVVDGGAPETCNPDLDVHCGHQGGPVPGNLEKYRLADNAFLGRANVGFAPTQIAITPDGATVFVADFDSRPTVECGYVAVINAKTMTALTPLEVPRSPHGLAVTPDGKTLVVASDQGDRVTLVDVATARSASPVMTEIPMGPAAGSRCKVAGNPSWVPPAYRPNTLALSPDGATAYVALTANHRVVAVDLAAQALTDFVVVVSPDPAQVSISPDGKTLVIPSASQAVIDVIDIPTVKPSRFDLHPVDPGVSSLFGAVFDKNDPNTAYVAAGCLTATRTSIGFSCQRLLEGALVQVRLDQPQASWAQVPLGSALHVTFAAPPATAAAVRR